MLHQIVVFTDLFNKSLSKTTLEKHNKTVENTVDDFLKKYL